MEYKQEVIDTMVKMFLMCDIIEQYATDIKPYTKQKTKMQINKVLIHTRKLVRDVDNSFNTINVEQFGNIADELRELIDNNLKK